MLRAGLGDVLMFKMKFKPLLLYRHAFSHGSGECWGIRRWWRWNHLFQQLPQRPSGHQRRSRRLLAIHPDVPFYSTQTRQLSKCPLLVLFLPNLQARTRRLQKPSRSPRSRTWRSASLRAPPPSPQPRPPSREQQRGATRQPGRRRQQRARGGNQRSCKFFIGASSEDSRRKGSQEVAPAAHLTH